MNSVKFLARYTDNDQKVHITPLGMTFPVSAQTWEKITRLDTSVGDGAIVEVPVHEFMQLAQEANK